MRRATFVALTQHFARSIAAPPLLTDLGVDYLRRTAASILAILIVGGAFMTRAFFRKYIDLHAMWDDIGFLRAVEADTLLLIAVPMLVIGLLSIIISPTLFPDEVDYRTLAHLPISRFEIFAAKFAAVALVACIAIAAVNVVTSAWFPFAIGARVGYHSPWISNALHERVGAHAIAAVAGSAWIFGAVMALQGVCLSLVPAARRRQAAVAVQGTVFVALLLSLSYVTRIPAMNVSSDRVSQSFLAWLPPVWFLGLNRWLLDPSAEGYAHVARIAVLSSGAIAITILVTYAYLFRRAEALAADARGPAAPRASASARYGSSGERLAPGTRAVLAFVWRGLGRSRLHQFVFLLVVGVGVAILLGQLLTFVEGRSFLGYRPRQPVHAVIAAPLLLGLAVTLALRAVFLLPLDQPAAWIFRLTEAPALRPAALNAVAMAFTAGATIPSTLLSLALQPGVLGGKWMLSVPLTLLANLVLVEVVLRDWARLPFTCSYLPGKRVLAYTLGVLLGTYFVFVYIGANLIRASMAGEIRAIVFGAALLTAYLALRRARLRVWGTQPLEFEDEDPLAIRTLNLLPDERN